MEFSYVRGFLFYVLCALVFSCSSDDDNQNSEVEVFENLTGTVLEGLSCNTESNGLAYYVEVDDFEIDEPIITGSLPEDLKVEQLRITFDVSPELFYVLTNISTIE